MSVDTRNKRSSATQVTLPWRGMLPVPNGAIDAGDRQQTGFMYRTSGPGPGGGDAATITFGIAHGGSMKGPGVVHIGP